MEKKDQARALIEEALNKYPELSLNSQINLQRMLDSILSITRGFNLDVIDSRRIDEIVSDAISQNLNVESNLSTSNNIEHAQGTFDRPLQNDANTMSQGLVNNFDYLVGHSSRIGWLYGLLLFVIVIMATSSMIWLRLRRR